MIAHAGTIDSHEDRFLEMLPQLHQQARFAFRDEPASRRQELVAETIANCWVAFVRLVQRGLFDIVYTQLPSLSPCRARPAAARPVAWHLARGP